MEVGFCAKSSGGTEGTKDLVRYAHCGPLLWGDSSATLLFIRGRLPPNDPKIPAMRPFFNLNICSKAFFFHGRSKNFHFLGFCDQRKKQIVMNLVHFLFTGGGGV